MCTARMNEYIIVTVWWCVCVCVCVGVGVGVLGMAMWRCVCVRLWFFILYLNNKLY